MTHSLNSASPSEVHDEFLVTLTGGLSGAPLYYSWDGQSPLALGHPTNFVLESLSDGSLRLQDLRGAKGVVRQAQIKTASWTGAVATLPMGSRTVEVRRLSRPSLVVAGGAPSGVLPEIPVSTAAVSPEERRFTRLIQVTHGILFACVLTAWLWPGSQTPQLSADAEKLIPPQYAKLLMAPKPKVEETKSSMASGGSSGESATPRNPADLAQKTQEKVANTAVVRAFRARALQSAVQGMLKGGMTRLLAAESHLLVGADSSGQVAQVFDRAPAGEFPSAPFASAGNGRGVQVASLGGGGGGASGGTGGAGVGYGTGHRAAVNGQGNSFVSLDLPGAAVEEGLSKEEVGKVIHAHISEIRYCYESSILRSPDLEGKLVLDFAIGSDGRVKTAAVKESSLNDARLDDCILRRLTKWSFPKPNGGVQVAVSYPFLFKSLKR